MRAALYLLNNSSETKRLIAWANYKQRKTRAPHFIKIRESYEARLHKAEHKLMMLRCRCPKQYWIARGLHMVSNRLSVNSA